MIAKIWRYELAAGATSAGAKQRVAYDIALGCSCYVLAVSPYSEAMDAFELARRVGDYVGAPDTVPERILRSYASGLVSKQPVAQASELAVHAANAGLGRVYHLVYSYREDDAPDLDTQTEHREIFQQVLHGGIAPSVGADHGDQPNPHHHELMVAVNPLSGEGVSFGQGWYIEACHIALAICEYRSELQPEPNRRYVADERGVYHMLSGARIADADGRMVRDPDDETLVDRKVIVAMQKQHDAIMKNNVAPDPELAGKPWAVERAVELMAAQRIKYSESWQELHRSLAMVGIRYTKTGTTARLELEQYGRDEADRNLFVDDKIEAGAAGSQAVLGRLSKRLGTFEPASADLKVRPFVMPRYDLPVDAQKAEERAAAREAKKQRAELEQHLKDEGAIDRREAQSGNLGKLMAYTSELLAEPRREEMLAVEELLVTLGAKRKRKARKPTQDRKRQDGQSAEPILFFDESEAEGLFWRGPPENEEDDSGKETAQEKQRKIDQARRAAAEREDEVRRRLEVQPYSVITRKSVRAYFRGRELAIVERHHIVAVHAKDQQTKIDALLLSQAKFGKVKLLGRRAWIREAAALSAELGIKLDKSQQHLAEQHLERIAKVPSARLIWGPSKPVEQTTTRPATAAKEAAAADAIKRRQVYQKQLMSEIEQQRRIRERLVEEKGPFWFTRLKQERDVDDERARRVIPIPIKLHVAQWHLDKMDRNRLLLMTSSFEQEGVRFLDDEALLQTLEGYHSHILRPELQARLKALKAIHHYRLLWTRNALTDGIVRIENNVLTASRKEDDWAIGFYEQQRKDASFRLMVMPEAKSRVDQRMLDTPPEITAWRRAHKTPPQDPLVIGAIADELYLRLKDDPEQLKATLKALDPDPKKAFDEAFELRRSSTRFQIEFKSFMPSNPNYRRRRGKPRGQATGRRR